MNALDRIDSLWNRCFDWAYRDGRESESRFLILHMTTTLTLTAAVFGVIVFFVWLLS
jgi:hypothetical protein